LPNTSLAMCSTPLSRIFGCKHDGKAS
jgi:hypothetical protein